MTADQPIIALDAMGGDNAPSQIVKGACWAARDLGMKVTLVGQRDIIEAELANNKPRPEGITVVHAPDAIAMDDDQPAQAARSKRESSIVVGLKLVKSGQADAFVSAGNTGAIVAATSLYVQRIRGIKRPALVGLIPLSGRLTALIDVGANADVRPEYLEQWARMGAAYMRKVWKIDNPTVALLNIGEEASKGSTLAQETYVLLEKSGLNFIGNLEGRDVPFGRADVLVTDGFTGNVTVKTMEGMADYINGELRTAIKSKPWFMLAGLLLTPAFNMVRKKTDYREYGAGPLLGVNGLVFIGHGRSDARAIVSSLRVAREAARSGMLEALREVAPPRPAPQPTAS